MPYTDWTNAVDLVIPDRKELSILEFGLGAGTKYLLDNFKFVYSYELIDERDHTLKEWAQVSKQEYKDYKNWEVEVINWGDIGFIDYDPNLCSKLVNRIDELYIKYNFEAILVDGGYHVRGDIANYILNKFAPKYVIIHDTNFNFEVDGYGRINLPKAYDTFKYNEGEGTYVFIKNNKTKNKL